MSEVAARARHWCFQRHQSHQRHRFLEGADRSDPSSLVHPVGGCRSTVSGGFHHDYLVFKDGAWVGRRRAQIGLCGIGHASHIGRYRERLPRGEAGLLGTALAEVWDFFGTDPSNPMVLSTAEGVTVLAVVLVAIAGVASFVTLRP